MATTYYDSVEGEITGEFTGSSQTDYLRDALGSVTGTTDSSATVKNTYRYKPYGTLLAKTGSDQDPRLQWVGTVGYYITNRAHSTHYVVARHFADEEGQFTTSVPGKEWLGIEQRYGYAAINPTTHIDPTGMAPGGGPPAQSAGCPQEDKPNEANADFAIACSKLKTDSIAANFTLPSLCNIPCKADYISFYLSMSGWPKGSKGYEAGVSFSHRRWGWGAFINFPGYSIPILTPGLAAGATVTMSLTRKPSGEVVFRFNGTPYSGGAILAQVGFTRLVNSSGYENPNCKTAHSEALWTDIVATPGGMQAKAWAIGEVIINELFSSRLRSASLNCDTLQFLDSCLLKGQRCVCNCDIC